MRVSESLNLVIPIYGNDDVISGYVHSMPIARGAFEANYKLIAATFTAIHGEGFGELSGPRIAHLVLKEIAATRGVADQADSLMNEILRLSCLIAPAREGWESVPLTEAISRKTIGEDDAAEVLSAIVFFTVGSAMYPRRKTAAFLSGAAQLWGASLSPLLPMEWIASLQTLTATANTGAKDDTSQGSTQAVNIQVTGTR